MLKKCFYVCLTVFSLLLLYYCQHFHQEVWLAQYVNKFTENIALAIVPAYIHAMSTPMFPVSFVYAPCIANVLSVDLNVLYPKPN